MRGVLATDFTHAKGEGVVFEPQLVLDLNRLDVVSGWRFGIAAGLVVRVSGLPIETYRIDGVEIVFQLAINSSPHAQQLLDRIYRGAQDTEKRS